MKSQAHPFLVAFERLILFPLDVVCLGLAGYFLWHHLWLIGGFLILVSFLFGIIGQGLPHHVKETLAELRSGEIEIQNGMPLLQVEDSTALAKAVIKTAALSAIMTLVLLRHYGFGWIATLTICVATWIPTSVLSAIVPAAWVWIFRERGQASRGVIND